MERHPCLIVACETLVVTDPILTRLDTWFVLFEKEYISVRKRLEVCVRVAGGGEGCGGLWVYYNRQLRQASVTERPGCVTRHKLGSMFSTNLFHGASVEYLLRNVSDIADIILAGPIGLYKFCLKV